MSTRRKPGDRQPELFARSTKPVIAIEMNHRLVRLTHELDWTELEENRATAAPKLGCHRPNFRASSNLT
jgi:hypothetical protein